MGRRKEAGKPAGTGIVLFTRTGTHWNPPAWCYVVPNFVASSYCTELCLETILSGDTGLKFIHSEKTTKNDEISQLFLTVTSDFKYFF